MFEHSFLDICADLGVLYMFCILVFVLVERNGSCCTQKGALEIQLLLLSFIIIIFREPDDHTARQPESRAGEGP